MNASHCSWVSSCSYVQHIINSNYYECREDLLVAAVAVFWQALLGALFVFQEKVTMATSNQYVTIFVYL